MGVETKQQLSYGVRGVTGSGSFIVWEYQDKSPVNEYVGYDNGTHLTLYPRRKLIPSTVYMEKKEVAFRDTRREF